MLFFGFIYRVFPYIQRTYAVGDEISIKEAKLAKCRAKALERDGLEADRKSLARTLDRMESCLLNGDTPALAAVDIQNILSRIAEKSKVAIKTVKVLKPTELDETIFLGIPVQFTITSTTRQLKEIFYGIESSLKFLRVKDVRIRAAGKRQIGKIVTILKVEGIMKR